MKDADKQEGFSEEQLDQFRYFLQDHDLDRINRNLRKVFFDYMRQQTAGLDVEFNTILDDMVAIFEFLDLCSDGTKDWKNKLPNAS